MKLDATTLSFARIEVDHHLLGDLNFTLQFYRFATNAISAKEYLDTSYGFKKFLYDYRVGRTIQAGDAAKLSILRIIKRLPANQSPVETIALLADAIRSKALSTVAVSGKYGLPQSFASKLLSIQKPDEVIPYDSYALKSINTITGSNHKSLLRYYEGVDIFRTEHFPEGSKEIQRIKLKEEKMILELMAQLHLDPEKVLSWKLTDKYLWCMEALRRSKG